MKKKENQPPQDNNRKNFSTQLIVTALCAVLSFGALAVATTAWFASNRNVNSTGMQIQVEPLGNLVISKSNTTDFTIESVSFSDDTSNMHPATYTSEYDSRLKYNTNPGAVDRNTGLEGSAALTFGEVVVATDNKSPYYHDYTVYIAATEKAFADQTLTATMSLAPAESTPEYMQAASILFFVDGNYATKINAIEGSTPVTLFDNKPIPLVSANNPIEITMRCYFDGDIHYQDNATDKAYIRNEILPASGAAPCTISVTFSTADKPPTSP